MDVFKKFAKNLMSLGSLLAYSLSAWYLITVVTISVSLKGSYSNVHPQLRFSKQILHYRYKEHLSVASHVCKTEHLPHKMEVYVKDYDLRQSTCQIPERDWHETNCN